MSGDIRHHIEAKRAFGTDICQRIIEAIAKLGFSLQTRIELPNFDAAEFSLVTDPFTQSRDLLACWYSVGRQRIGQIRFHGDGSFFAEYDVLLPHPGKTQVFIEAINAWGRQGAIKTETKLLEMPR